MIHKSAILEAICKILTVKEEGSPIRFYPHEYHMEKVGGTYAPAGRIRIALFFRERQLDEWSFLKGNEMGVMIKDDKNVIQELAVEVISRPGETVSVPEWSIRIPGTDTSALKAVLLD
jgi:hypothetical protein